MTFLPNSLGKLSRSKILLNSFEDLFPEKLIFSMAKQYPWEVGCPTVFSLKTASHDFIFLKSKLPSRIQLFFVIVNFYNLASGKVILPSVLLFKQTIFFFVKLFILSKYLFRVYSCLYSSKKYFYTWIIREENLKTFYFQFKYF